MPAITYSEFSGGLDRRLPIGVQDANRLWTLTNAYITSGKKIKKRPGLRRIGSVTGTVGLEALDESPTVFADSSLAVPAGVSLVTLEPYVTYTLFEVTYCQTFQGYPFVVALHRPPSITSGLSKPAFTVARHHYVDGAATLVTDANCPHGLSVTKAASRIFSIDGEVVRHCAAGDARDWTTSSDAGFLPVTLQSDSRAECKAVGTFEDALVVLFPDAAQIWDVATDPSANQIRRRMSGGGTVHPQSLAGFYRDLVFASRYGVRSISVQENVDRFDETDVGVPVDSLVASTQVAYEAGNGEWSALRVRGAWLPSLGQYWLCYPSSDETTTVYAYSFSRSSKLAAWAVYELPIAVRGICSAGGSVYVRSRSDLYVLDADTHEDEVNGGTAIAIDVQMAFQDAKLPGVEKMFYGADFVFSGTAQVSYLYDPRDTTKETAAYSVQGDTRSTTVVPVEVSAAAIAPRFQHSADEAFEISMLTLYFHSLSANSS